MGFPRQCLLCVTVCLLVTAFSSAQEEANSCSVYKGSRLRTFAKGSAEVRLPCRYKLAEFMCHMRTELYAESAVASDGKTFVTAVTVRTSGDVDNGQGQTVQATDEASIDMTGLGKFIDGGDFDKPHWDTSGQALVDMASDGSTWRLLESFDAEKQQTVLKGGKDQLRVYLTYVDKDKDKSKKGYMRVACYSENFGKIPDTSGELCGNAGDSKNHIKDAATALKMTAPQYLMYTMLVEQDVPQSNALCEDAKQITKTCADPQEAVRICSEMLDPRLYAKCFVKSDIDPLASYVQCVRWACRRDVLSCRTLLDTLHTCPGKGRVKKILKCGDDPYRY